MRAGARTNLIVGFWAAVVMAASVVAALATVRPAKSGPFCLADCVAYPYADIARFFPAEYIWMYLMLVAVLAMVVLAAALYELNRSLSGLIGLAFAILVAAVLAIAYFVQIEVIQPSVLAGETDGVAMLTQYNPHGVFIALEELGYLLMPVALFAMALTFAASSWLARALRWLAGANLVATLAAFLAVHVVFGVHREYYFEVVAILTNWATMIAGGVIIAILLRRAAQLSPTPGRGSRSPPATA